MAIPSQQPFTLRLAQLSDAPTIAHLGAHVFTTTVAHAVDPTSLSHYLHKTYTPSSIQHDLTSDLKTIIVATDTTNRLVGFIYLSRGTNDPCLALAKVTSKIEVQRIYIDPGAQGTGLGRLLAGEVERVAVGEGVRSIWLGVWEGNLRARAAYERWGYEVVGEHEFVIGEVVQRDLIMLKRLG